MVHVNEWFGLFYLLYCCCFAFAMVRVISAVFVTETMKILGNDLEIALEDRKRSRKAQIRKCETIFQELDDSHDGMLNKEEFNRLKSDKLLRGLLETLGVGPR